MRASIRRSINNTYIAKAEDNKIYTLKIKGKTLTTNKWEYNPISVGDTVSFEPYSESEGLIISREERKSEFTRFLNKVSLNQCTCANFDQALIVASLKSPEFNPRFIDRVIASIKCENILIAVNKSDNELTWEMDDINLYRDLGYSVILVSALNNKVDELIPLLVGKVTAFIGQSGVGKSSLVNILTGSEQRVGDINEKYNRGKHTTNHALFIERENFSIIDTPGIREVIPPLENYEDLRDSFIELRNLDCKFSDCLHDGEKGCAVPSLIEDGIIDEGRYISYLTLLDDLKSVHDRIIRNKW